MKVYQLTKDLVAKKGIYNSVWGFEPIKDADGNMICGLADGENNNFPFAADIKLCEQIEFVPKVIEKLQ